MADFRETEASLLDFSPLSRPRLGILTRPGYPLRGSESRWEIEGISLNESIRIREPSREQEFYIGDLSAYSLGAKRNSTFRTGRFRLILSTPFPSTCRQAFEESISISIDCWPAKIRPRRGVLRRFVPTAGNSNRNKS